MPDRDELDLSALTRTPVGPLPGAAAARQRGEQRTRRTRAALAGAGALVAVLAVTAGATLAGGGQDRIMPGPVADPPAEEGFSASLLDPEDLDGTWALRTTKDLPFAPLPDGCRSEEEVYGTPAATALRFLDGEQRVLGHALHGYAQEAQARDAFGRLVDAMEECAPTYELFGGLPGSGPDRVYGRYIQAEYAVAFAVERVGAVLSGVAVRALRPEPSVEELPPYAEAAREEVSGGPFDAPQPAAPSPPPPGPQDALLTPGEAAQVEPGAWRVSSDRPATVFDPCRGSRPFLPHQQSAVASLFLDRERGGSTLDHQVLLYGTAQEAGQVLEQYREAVQVCAPNPVAGGDGTTSYEVVRDADHELWVAVDEQCPACPPDSPHVVVISQAARGLSVLRVAVVEQGGPGAGLVEGHGARAREKLASLT